MTTEPPFAECILPGCTQPVADELITPSFTPTSKPEATDTRRLHTSATQTADTEPTPTRRTNQWCWMWNSTAPRPRKGGNAATASRPPNPHLASRRQWPTARASSPGRWHSPGHQHLNRTETTCNKHQICKKHENSTRYEPEMMYSRTKKGRP